jgi:hypothetical protein
LRFFGNDVKQGQRRTMRGTVTPFPVPQGANADTEFGSKFHLRKTQTAA